MLKISNLSVKAGKKQILNNVSLFLKPDEVQVLMGPNGSGKSTLAQTLAGNAGYKVPSFQQPVSSKETVVELDRKNLLAMKPYERARAGLFVSFQEPVGIPGVKVFDFLINCRNALDTSARQYSSILKFKDMVFGQAKRLGLKDGFLDRPLNHHFSGGEKKRLELLQAILFKPKYAIFDEIDSGIDLDGLKLAAKTIKSLQKNGAGILLITHQPKILRYVKPGKIHILINGQIVKSGNSEILAKLERSGYKSYYCALCKKGYEKCPKHMQNKNSK